MKLSEKDRAEINRLILNSLSIERACRDWPGFARCLKKCPCPHEILPDFCSDDAQAWDAVKQLMLKRLRFQMMSSGTLEVPIVRLRFSQVGTTKGVDGDGTGDNPLADALRDTMVERYQEVMTGDGINGESHMSWRLKPALEAILKRGT